MSLVTGLGPLEENEATNGAILSSTSTIFSIIAVGLLCIQGVHEIRLDHLSLCRESPKKRLSKVESVIA